MFGFALPRDPRIPRGLSALTRAQSLTKNAPGRQVGLRLTV